MFQVLLVHYQTKLKTSLLLKYSKQDCIVNTNYYKYGWYATPSFYSGIILPLLFILRVIFMPLIVIIVKLLCHS